MLRFSAKVLMMYTGGEIRPELSKRCVCGFEVEVGWNDGVGAGGELHDGLRQLLLLCHVVEACG